MSIIEAPLFQPEDFDTFLTIYEYATRNALKETANEMITLYAPNIYKIMEAIFESLPQSK